MSNQLKKGKREWPPAKPKEPAYKAPNDVISFYARFDRIKERNPQYMPETLRMFVRLILLRLSCLGGGLLER